ncbi:MAG: M48 family metalloprotease [Ferruginibacter sp.]
MRTIFFLFIGLMIFSSCDINFDTADGPVSENERKLPRNMEYSYECIKADSGSLSGILGKADNILGKVATFNIEVSDQEQNKFGDTFLIESLKDKNFIIDSINPINAKLDTILTDLLGKRVKPTGIVYNMYLLADTSTINAYTVGGKIFITTGMISKCTNDDQLYAIIGHEIGHNEKGHIKNSIKQMKASNKFFGKWGDAFIVVKRILTGSFNHKNELEADYFGLDLTWKLGYDICAIRTFWDDMAKGEKRNTINDFFRTHPYSDTRSKCLVDHIQKNFKVSCK